MRWFPALLLAASLTTSSFAADASIVRVWPEWRNADAFDRIREYFGGPENDGREIVVRTHPEQRAGMYFVIRVKSATALPGAKFVLDVIRPDDPAAKTYTFPVSLPGRSQLTELGLTADDWPAGRGAHPVAWKVTLLDSAGHPVTSEQSFLWEKPAR